MEMIRKGLVSCFLLGWWQLKHFLNVQPENCGNDAIWRAYYYLSKGWLKPPTRVFLLLVDGKRMRELFFSFFGVWWFDKVLLSILVCMSLIWESLYTLMDSSSPGLLSFTSFSSGDGSSVLIGAALGWKKIVTVMRCGFGKNIHHSWRELTK